MGSLPLTDQQVQSFRSQLLEWFRQSARDLPWRRTRDPYRIWVSEVMLQQTRVAAVTSRYIEFISRFPSPIALALAREDEVLALWSGLGYYRRARLLHSAAQFLVREHQGSLPPSSVELRRLPGVGDYTAAAIASIAHNEPVAVVDGNVERVLMRIFGMGGAGRHPSAGRLKEAAQSLLDPENAGSFNQAMMELGATVCLPRLPLCAQCPVLEFCQTRGECGPRRAKQMMSRRMSHALVRKQLEGKGNPVAVLLVRRSEDAAHMPGMWELPVLDEDWAATAEPILRIRHSITNTNYYIGVFARDASDGEQLARSGREDWVPSHKLGDIPLTGLTRKILMRLNVLAKPKEIRRGKALPGSENLFL